MINSYYIQSYGKKGVYFMVKIAKHISKDRVKWLRDAGLTIPEIARVLQVSPNRVQSLIAKVLDGMRKGNAEERLRAYEKHFPVEAASDNPVGELEIARLARDQQAIQAELAKYKALLGEVTGVDLESEEHQEVILETLRRVERRQKKRAKRQRQRKG
jgi:DNA-binding transcriptional MerR regulator